MKNTLLALSLSLLFFHANAQSRSNGSVPLEVLQAFSQEEPKRNNNQTSAAASLAAFAEVADAPVVNTNNIVSQYIEPAPAPKPKVIAKPVAPVAVAPAPAPVASVPQPEPVQPVAVASGDIASLLNSRYVQFQGKKVRLRSLDDVRELYNTFDGRALWTANGKVTALGMDVINATQDAWQHALRPAVYHSKATEGVSIDSVLPDSQALDVILSDAFITYKKHLANGIVDPKKQFSTWNQKPSYFNFAQLYRSASSKGKVSHILTVDNPDYQKLQRAYIGASGSPASGAQIPSQTLRPGSKGKAVVALRERLGLSTQSDVYDDAVKSAVKKYQKASGLSADGIAGKRTIAHLNGKGGSKKNAKKLALNMERLRWQKTPPSGNYIWVNIPAYKMAVRNGGKYIFESNVIVGRKERPTPIFSDILEHIVLAPYWNVPSTIFKEDKLPILQKNPNALGKDMEVVERATGKVVEFKSVDWETGGTGYRLRQLPGPQNSLGKMKFLFPNHHAIYLHDTPNRSLFKRKSRALSSGCVRVEKAEDLAVFLLSDMGYNRKRIQSESQQKKEKWINLEKKLRYPVYLNYYTAWPDSKGVIRYSSDIYGYDKQLDGLYQSALKNL